jgi:hypothetical protein
MSVDGMGPAQIARALNVERLLNPSAYKHAHGILQKSRPCKDPYHWHTTTVHKILDAPEYLGQTINFKTFTKSYKDNKCRFNPPEKRLVFEDTHPAIVDEETWAIVRKMRQHKRRAPRHGKSGLFSGVAYCADCNAKLYYHTRALKARSGTRYEGSYSCSEYRKDVVFQQQRKCTCHFIREGQLEELVLDDLRSLLAFVAVNEKQFVRLVMDKSRQEQDRELTAKKKLFAKHRKQIAELDTIIERLYVDNVSGKVSDERYEKMSAKFEAEQANLQDAMDALESVIATLDEQSDGVDKFLDSVRRTTEIEALTPAVIHEFIDRIIIHEPESPRKNRQQKVEIVYNRIGKIDLQAWLAGTA